MTKILLHVEDSECQRAYFRLRFKQLKLKDIKLVQVEDVMSAIDIIAMHNVVLAVIDYHLPGFNGDSLLSTLRSKNVPCMFFTAVPKYEVKNGTVPVYTKAVDDLQLFSDLVRMLV